MDIGLVLQTDPPGSRVVELAARADLGGFTHVWTFDSSVLWQEPFVIYSQILARTSNVTVGPMVTNPLSRELSVTASLFATLNDMFGNRTVCGIGRGDSAMRVLGRTPASLATLGHAINVIRDLAEDAHGRVAPADAAHGAVAEHVVQRGEQRRGHRPVPGARIGHHRPHGQRRRLGQDRRVDHERLLPQHVRVPGPAVGEARLLGPLHHRDHAASRRVGLQDHSEFHVNPLFFRTKRGSRYSRY